MEPGTIIAERYRLQREIGRGAMGSVWLATHLSLEREVAIKILHLEAAQRESSLARFQREGKLLAMLRTTHVAQVHDIGRHDGLPFIVMERLSGESLRERLERCGHLDLTTTTQIVTQAARALVEAHALGLVHRDIKPANIFLEEHEDELRVKLLDFGACKVTDLLADDSVEPTQTGALIGTPYYLSPEQAQGLKTVGPPSDLWSLAVVAFECISGRRPFAARAIGPLIAQILHAEIPSVAEVAPACASPQLDAWFRRSMAREPSARFASARAMAEALARVDPVGDRARVQGESAATTQGMEQTLMLDSGEQTLALETRDDAQPNPSDALPFVSPAPALPSTNRVLGIVVGVVIAVIVAALGYPLLTRTAPASTPSKPATVD